MEFIEAPAFTRHLSSYLSDDGYRKLQADLAANPELGDLMPGTGGFRKLRWALQGRGKRGGARVIYFVHSERFPLFLLTAYAKNERADLSPADRAEFRQLVKQLASTYEGKQ